MVFSLYVVSANLAMLSAGLSVGWTSSFEPKILNGEETIRMTNDQSSWMDPLMLLGIVLGGTASAMMLNRIGRKKTLLLTAPINIISWLLIIVARSPTEIMCSRAMSGVGSGLCFCATAIYLSEIASVRSRGAVCGTQLLFYELGCLLSNIAVLFLGAKIHALMCLMIPIVFTVLFVTAPETPYYLMLRGNYDMAQKALVKCRGKKDVEDETKMIASTIEHDLTSGKSFLNLFNRRSNVKSLTIVLCITFSRSMAGSEHIHDHAEDTFFVVFSHLDAKYLPIVLGILKVCNSALIIILVDNSRRLVMLLSTVVAGITTFIMAFYYVFRETSANTAMLAVVIVVAEIGFTLIFTSCRLSFILAGDLFTTSMKAYALPILTIASHLGHYGTVHFYRFFSSNTPIYASLFTASAIDFTSILLIHFCNMPETGQKTFMEIQQLLQQTDDSEDKFSRAPTLRVR